MFFDNKNTVELNIHRVQNASLLSFWIKPKNMVRF